MSVGGGLAAGRAAPLVRLGGRRGGGGRGGGGCSGRKRVSLESALICNWDVPCRDRERHNEYMYKEGSILTEWWEVPLKGKQHSIQVINWIPLTHFICPQEAPQLPRAEKESKSYTCMSSFARLNQLHTCPAYITSQDCHIPHRTPLWTLLNDQRTSPVPHRAKTPCEISLIMLYQWPFRGLLALHFRILCHESAVGVKLQGTEGGHHVLTWASDVPVVLGRGSQIRESIGDGTDPWDSWLAGCSGERASLLSSSKEELSATFG